jgi:hypothetical protein
MLPWESNGLLFLNHLSVVSGNHGRAACLSPLVLNLLINCAARGGEGEMGRMQIPGGRAAPNHFDSPSVPRL